MQTSLSDKNFSSGSYLGVKPDFSIPENKRGKDWYGNAVLYFCRFWNQPFPVYARNQSMLGDPLGFVRTRPINNILDNWMFALGRQDIGISSALLGGDNPDAALNIYRPGNEVFEIIKSKVGRFVDFISNLKPSTELLSPEAMSRKMAKIEAVLMKLDNDALFQSLAEVGLIFDPIPPGVDIRTKDALMRKQNEVFKEKGQIIGERIALWQARALELERIYKSVCLQTEVAGLCGIENRIVGGKLTKRVIPGHCLIWDYTSQDDDFNSYGRFRGIVDYYLPVREILARDGHLMDAEDRKELEELANQDTGTAIPPFIVPYINAYSQGGLSLWYNAANPPYSDWMSRVTMYFKGPYDYRLVEKKDGSIVKLQEKDVNGMPITAALERAGDFHNEIWYKCTVAGGKYVYDFGPCENQAFDPLDPVNPICPLTVVIPDVMMGQYNSSVSRIKKLQQDIDFYQAKVKEKAVKDYGLNHILDGKALGVEDAADMYKDFKGMGIHVKSIEREPGEPVSSTHVQIDQRLDPNVRMYIELSREMKKIMQENASVPDAALGTAPAYIGKGVQQQQIGMSNQSLTPFYRTLVLGIQKDIQVGVNMQKIAFYALNMDETVRSIIGEDGLNFIKLTPEFSLEMLGVYIRIDDMITVEDRRELIGYAMALGQNGVLGMSDWLKLKTLPTYTDMINYFEGLEQRIQAQQQEMMLAQQQAQFEQAMAAKQMEGQNKAIDAEAHVQGKQIAADAQVASKEMDVVAKDAASTDALIGKLSQMRAQKGAQ